MDGQTPSEMIDHPRIEQDLLASTQGIYQSNKKTTSSPSHNAVEFVRSYTRKSENPMGARKSSGLEAQKAL